MMLPTTNTYVCLVLRHKLYDCYLEWMLDHVRRDHVNFATMPNINTPVLTDNTNMTETTNADALKTKNLTVSQICTELKKTYLVDSLDVIEGMHWRRLKGAYNYLESKKLKIYTPADFSICDRIPAGEINDSTLSF